MRTLVHVFGVLVAMIGVAALGQSKLPLSPLCKLQVRVPQGEHRRVRVEGVYLSGLEGQYLVAAGCSDRSTDVEFALKSHRLWNQLVELSNRSNDRNHSSGDSDPVRVVFDGEFYGPPLPDPKLPAAIRKNYHPGWDHNDISTTKLVVSAIQSVRPLSPGDPCAPRKSDANGWPCFQHHAVSDKK